MGQAVSFDTERVGRPPFLGQAAPSGLNPYITYVGPVDYSTIPGVTMYPPVVAPTPVPPPKPPVVTAGTAPRAVAGQTLLHGGYSYTVTSVGNSPTGLHADDGTLIPGGSVTLDHADGSTWLINADGTATELSGPPAPAPTPVVPTPTPTPTPTPVVPTPTPTPTPAPVPTPPPSAETVVVGNSYSILGNTATLFALGSGSLGINTDDNPPLNIPAGSQLLIQGGANDGTVMQVTGPGTWDVLYPATPATPAPTPVVPTPTPTPAAGAAPSTTPTIGGVPIQVLALGSGAAVTKTDQGAGIPAGTIFADAQGNEYQVGASGQITGYSSSSGTLTTGATATSSISSFLTNALSTDPTVEWISGIPNLYLTIGGAIAAAFAFSKKKR